MTKGATLTSDNPSLFGVAIVRNGKRWQASAEDKAGHWGPWVDGKTPALALEAALKREAAPADDLDFG